MRSLAVVGLIASLAVGGMLAVVACSGRTLDLGSSRDAFAGFLLDDEACAVSVATVRDAGNWVTYRLDVVASCRGYGRVSLAMTSRGDLAYPHPCGMETALSVAIVGEAGAFTGQGVTGLRFVQ